MKKHLLAAICSAGMLLAASSTFAENIKVGLIDIPQIAQHSKQVAMLYKNLQQQFAPQQKKIMDLQKQLRETAQKLNASDANKSLSPQARKQLQDKIIQDQKNIQSMVVTSQQAFAAAQNKMEEQFYSTLKSTVQTVAQKDKLDLVLLKPVVLYSTASTDITKEVLDSMPK